MDWWDELEQQVLGCLRTNGSAMAPRDVARRLGMSEPSVVSVLCLLAQEGRVAIRLVDCAADAADRRSRVA